MARKLTTVAVPDFEHQSVAASDKRYEFQVNLHFGRNEMSAFGAGHSIYACTLSGLMKKIQKKTGLRSEQIILTFQPE